jgi:hypothetical protein
MPDARNTPMSPPLDYDPEVRDRIPEAQREELNKTFGPKSLTKQIPGQRMIMAPKTSSSSRESFTYGNFEEVYP